MSLAEFYDKWYQHGYMDEWPAEKKERVYNLIRELPLPEKGKALDFGCGNGIFTDVIKKALPEWEVYGSDLSAVAVSNASKRFTDCRFLFGHSDELSSLKFDFIFSHHVLEHVDDKQETALILNNLAAENVVMLHILPCGNEGSFEYKLCSLMKNGIQAHKGGTFYFEEEMHLQRFTTDTFAALFQPLGFKLEKGWYANQFFGAIQWISRMPKQFIQELASRCDAKNWFSALRLRFYVTIFICLYYLQRPYFLLQNAGQNTTNQVHIGKKIFYFISLIFKKGIDVLAEREWRVRNKKLNGSEMYLFFKKSEE